MIKETFSTKDSLQEIFQKIDTILEKLDFSEKEKMEMRLALEEVLLNVFYHAYKTEEGSFELQLEKKFQEVSMKIIDEGVPFDVSRAAVSRDPPTSLSDCPIGGVGLLLIREMVDEISYSRDQGRNILTLKKRCQSF